MHDVPALMSQAVQDTFQFFVAAQFDVAVEPCLPDESCWLDFDNHELHRKVVQIVRCVILAHKVLFGLELSVDLGTDFVFDNEA